MNYLKYLSMTELNRLRGTKPIYAKVIGLYFGLLFFITLQNPYISIAIAVLYIAGESTGWGEWVGGLIRRIAGIPVRDNPSRERMIYGIRKIALKFSKTDTVDYHATSLFIRGLYWWGLTFFPLYWALDPLLVSMTILFLASWFPLSVLLAESDSNHWKSAERIYGSAQNIGVGLLLLS